MSLCLYVPVWVFWFSVLLLLSFHLFLSICLYICLSVCLSLSISLYIMCIYNVLNFCLIIANNIHYWFLCVCQTCLAPFPLYSLSSPLAAIRQPVCSPFDTLCYYCEVLNSRDSKNLTPYGSLQRPWHPVESNIKNPCCAGGNEGPRLLIGCAAEDRTSVASVSLRPQIAERL